eukprot:jgi/Mesvir1/21689/Mv04109-RA.1
MPPLKNFYLKKRVRKKTATTGAAPAAALTPTNNVKPAGEASDYSDSSDEGKEDYKKGGYHPVSIGDKLSNGRYTVMKKLGWGHFSTVWLAYDRVMDRYVALKVQKSAAHYTDAAWDEIELLKQTGREDVSGTKGIVRLLDSFEHQGPNGRHVCMVMESLGDNLLTLIKRFRYRGIPLVYVKEIAYYILMSLDYLHRELSIIHTDLKPENILLVEPLDTPDYSTLSMPCRKTMDLGRLGGRGSLDINALASAVLAGGGDYTSLSSHNNNTNDPAASNSSMTKNQKKKFKKKLKKALGGIIRNKSPGSSGRSPHNNAPAGSAPGGKVGASPRDQRGGGGVPWLQGRKYGMACKIVDLGNACWTYKQFTSDIQTRQYRCPEVLLGKDYSTPADIWSVACIVFELATGDVLFDPRSGEDYDRDEDHIALMMELLGPFPPQVILGGKYSRRFFTRNNELRHIHRLKFWPMEEVLMKKYGFPEDEAKPLSNFLLGMLNADPLKRVTAGDALKHPWLEAHRWMLNMQPARSRRMSGVAARPDGPMTPPGVTRPTPVGYYADVGMPVPGIHEGVKVYIKPRIQNEGYRCMRHPCTTIECYKVLLSPTAADGPGIETPKGGWEEDTYRYNRIEETCCHLARRNIPSISQKDILHLQLAIGDITRLNNPGWPPLEIECQHTWAGFPTKAVESTSLTVFPNGFSLRIKRSTPACIISQSTYWVLLRIPCLAQLEDVQLWAPVPHDSLTVPAQMHADRTHASPCATQSPGPRHSTLQYYTLGFWGSGLLVAEAAVFRPQVTSLLLLLSGGQAGRRPASR